MSKSTHVCEVCGVAVHLWAKPTSGGSYWKHSSGGPSDLSCGRPPRVVTREAYEADLRAVVEALRSR